MLTRKIKEYQSFSPHVAEICSPLKSLGVVGFFYVRRFPKNEFLDLTSKPQYAELSVKKMLSGHYSQQTISDHIFMEQGIRLWELTPDDEFHQDGKKYFSYGNGITICERSFAYEELYGFYSMAHQAEMSQFYLQHIDFFRKFKTYFIEKASSMIQSADANRFILPKKYYSNMEPHVDIRVASIQKRLQLKLLQSYTPLTQRELDCLNWVIQGKSYGETGELLGIAQRTVENYVANIKSKWNCKKISELVNLAGKMALFGQ